MINAFLIPKEGVTVKFPGTQQALPATGALVTMTTYWYRRLRDKDVTEIAAPKDAVVTAPPRVASRQVRSGTRAVAPKAKPKTVVQLKAAVAAKAAAPAAKAAPQVAAAHPAAAPAASAAPAATVDTKPGNTRIEK